jgi:hypothetical protein
LCTLTTRITGQCTGFYQHSIFLQNGEEKEKDEKVKHVCDILLRFARDENLEYNLRADATDVLLRLAPLDVKEQAKAIIAELGKADRNENQTLYTNKQNVHTEAIEESVEQCIDFLQSFDILKHNGSLITFEFVENKIKELCKNYDTDKTQKVNVALNRIYLDKALYGKYNCTLITVLLRIWTYLTNHEHEDDIQKRLIEELCDMAYTCSSGFVSRLVNVISGFGDFSITISWRDQISANFIGRLNAKIRDMDNLTEQEKILAQATIDPAKYEERKNYNRFLRKNIPDIREEMALEFKDHISDTDFDLYFRSAISFYEFGN